MNTALEPPGPTPRPLPRLAVAAIFRNEAPYVVEWLAHHRVVGVDAFYIADNDSDDGTSELLQALHELGYVKRIPFPSPPGQAPQMPAYAEILGRHAAAEDWVAVIDADEFIMPERDDIGPKDVLACLGERPGVGAVALNWVTYGSAGQVDHGAGLVMERFDRHADPSFWVNHHIKSIVRMQAFEGLHGNPHLFTLKPGYHYVHANGDVLVDHSTRGPGLSQQLVWEGLRLNHYVVKSREEFAAKQRKGSAAVLGRTKGDDYFRAHDRNDIHAPVPPALLARVKAEMAAIEAALRDRGAHPPAPPTQAARLQLFPQAVRGHIDRVEWRDGRLNLWGWALQQDGQAPACLRVRLGPEWIDTPAPRWLSRPDVNRQYPLVTALCGFHVGVPAPQRPAADATLEVWVGPHETELHGPLPLSTQAVVEIKERLAQAKTP